MRADLDRLMKTRALTALIVTGDEHENPLLKYISGGARISYAIAIKLPDAPFTLVVNDMETEEAAESGLPIVSYNQLGFADLVIEAEGDRTKALVALWGRIFQRFGVPAGKVGIYGVGSLHVYQELTRLLQQAHPQYSFVGEMGMTLFDEAFITKDADEIARIRSVATRTSRVLRQTWDFISSHRAQGDQVVKTDGSPLTIGDVKRFIRRACLDLDLQEGGTIFAQGRDAGYPHSRGREDEGLRLGQSLIFDFFPREIGGGYYHDSTRTWCIGYAPPEVQAAYETVVRAYQAAVQTFEVGCPAKALQEAALDVFEAAGHPTVRSHPGTNEGYVHSLGHGVGLNIHERPSMSHLGKDVLERGNVISIEPGLYYPERGYGVRVEDLYWVDERGELVNLTDFPHDLILPLHG